ncbi:hypothetical protein KAR91_29525 [Candidatus Pacearchaeota archaeon]|nr:hypothetical protein [Candidatus Pacearchaeota archaeon]
MAEVFQFYGREIFDPGVYSKILTIGAAAPSPAGVNALCIIAEASNGPVFGETVAVGGGSTAVSNAKLILGDQGPAIEAVFQAVNASPSLSSAQDIRVFNPRALVQATETIYETAPATGATIDLASRIYGPLGNGVTVALASQIATVTFPWSEDPIERTIDNPIMDIIMASGFVTIDADKISVGLTGALTDFEFVKYPKLIELINAIEAQEPTATVTKDVNTSDNVSTIGLFDHVLGETDIATLYTLKGDIKELVDFFNAIPDLEATLLATATTMVNDFSLSLSGGDIGTDPDATQWGLVYDELAQQSIALTCPINDGLTGPYDETLTKAVMSLDEQHAIAMNQPDQRGKKRQAFISAHGGYGWSGQLVTPPVDADAIVTLSNLHNSEYSQFFGDGVVAIDQSGIERAQVPCYFAVKCASLFVGGLASRVLTSQQITAIRATTNYDSDDRKKLHKASVVIPVTDQGTFIRQFYTTWKSDAQPMKTVPSRIRCALLSDNDVARKLESWIKVKQGEGIEPFNSEGITRIKRTLQSHQNKSVNWVSTFGAVTFASSGIKFEYEIEDLVVPVIPEYGFGTTNVLNT